MLSILLETGRYSRHTFEKQHVEKIRVHIVCISLQLTDFEGRHGHKLTFFKLKHGIHIYQAISVNKKMHSL